MTKVMTEAKCAALISKQQYATVLTYKIGLHLFQCAQSICTQHAPQCSTAGVQHREIGKHHTAKHIPDQLSLT